MPPREAPVQLVATTSTLALAIPLDVTELPTTTYVKPAMEPVLQATEVATKRPLAPTELPTPTAEAVDLLQLRRLALPMPSKLATTL